MNILGISCFYHDSSACLVKDGVVLFAAQEERFNRIKGSSDFPINAINYCIQAGDITFLDIDAIVFYEKPYLKFERVLFDYIKSYPLSFGKFLRDIPHWLNERLNLPIYLKEKLGMECPIFYVPHHMSHASSAFFASKFYDAAIITADGVGEWTTTSIAKGKDNKITNLQEIKYPHSLGLLYSTITSYLGFSVNTGEGKTMAFASYGKPAHMKEFEDIIKVDEHGGFRLNGKYFSFSNDKKMYTEELVKLFGQPRKKDDYSNQKYFNIASSLQKTLENTILKIADYAYQLTGSKNVCLAGGVFLNCVTNTLIAEKTPFKNIFIQPAAGDAGGSLGAALYIYYEHYNNKRNYSSMDNAYLGPSFVERELYKSIFKAGLNIKKMEENKLIDFIVNQINKGKIIGLFQGSMEFGPRALGSRSILADVRKPMMKDYLNSKIKHREPFRPYGVIVLKGEAKKYFNTSFDSPYMLMIGNINKKLSKFIPGGLHVDGTSRLQIVDKKNNPFIYKLLKKFKQKYKLGMMINTSFNDKDEPIVCTPDDAIRCFLKTNIDYLIMKNYIVSKIAL